MSRNMVGRPMEILMVEDSLVFGRITIGALRRGNVPHRLTWMWDGSEALEFLFRSGRFKQRDLILLDLGLPYVDGREVLGRIKDDSGLQTIPVVVMTASTSDEDRIASESRDVAAYLTKPVNLPKFLRLVGDLRHCWRSDMIMPVVA